MVYVVSNAKPEKLKANNLRLLVICLLFSVICLLLIFYPPPPAVSEWLLVHRPDY
jgi:hypothetical protein